MQHTMPAFPEGKFTKVDQEHSGALISHPVLIDVLLNQISKNTIAVERMAHEQQSHMETVMDSIASLKSDISSLWFDGCCAPTNCPRESQCHRGFQTCFEASNEIIDENVLSTEFGDNEIEMPQLKTEAFMNEEQARGVKCEYFFLDWEKKQTATKNDANDAGNLDNKKHFQELHGQCTLEWEPNNKELLSSSVKAVPLNAEVFFNDLPELVATPAKESLVLHRWAEGIHSSEINVKHQMSKKNSMTRLTQKNSLFECEGQSDVQEKPGEWERLAGRVSECGQSIARIAGRMFWKDVAGLEMASWPRPVLNPSAQLYGKLRGA